MANATIPRTVVLPARKSMTSFPATFVPMFVGPLSAPCHARGRQPESSALSYLRDRRRRALYYLLHQMGPK